MKKMTFGKKIALGFGSLILICGIVGSLAVFSMKSVQQDATNLSTKFVPEADIAASLESAVWKVQVAIRTYGLTADAAYLDEAHQALTEVHKAVQDAQKLSDANPDLVKLSANLKELGPVLADYEKAIAATEAKNKDIDAAREKLNENAAGFIANIDKLIASQEANLDKEIKSFAEAGKLQERAYKIKLANTIRGNGNAARIAVFKSQALRDPKIIEDGLNNFVTMDAAFDELAKLLRVQQDIDELNLVKANASTYRDTMKEVMDDSSALDQIAKQRREFQDKLRDLAGETASAGIKRTIDAADESNQKLASASWKTVAGLLIGLVVAVTVAFFIIRGTTKVLGSIASGLDDGSSQVASAAGQVSSASQTLAEGASEQAASLEETSSSLEEMASMTKRNAENAQKANELAKQAREVADKGVGDMATMNSAMASIKVSSDDIAKIIKTIDEIAFQTNILALNAAVEAARAGEAGMGFAVVADEVRNLAQRSAQAAKETAGKIEGAIGRTAQGVEISQKVAERLNEIVSKVRQVDELVAEVAGASREQTQGITQINTAVGQMDKVTQSNAANAEESAAAAEELNAHAEMMKHAVAELMSLVGNVPAARTKPAHAPAKPATNGKSHTNGNGHASRLSVPAPALSGHRRSEIPMDGDFKDF